MRITRLNTTLIFIALVSCLFSCKKEDNNNDIQAGELKPGRCRVNCNITGAFSSNYKSMDYYSFASYIENLNPLDNGLNCDGVNFVESTGEKMNILIHASGSDSVGNYNLKNLKAQYLYVMVTKNNISTTNIDTTWIAKYGDDFVLNITKLDWNGMEGTFNGTIQNATVNGNTFPKPIVINNGTFRGIFTH